MAIARDRTHEFFTRVKGFQMKDQFRNNLNGATANGTTKKSQVQLIIQQNAIFTKNAKKIAEDLKTTCVKLDWLTAHAKRTSLFDDKQREIDELTLSIRNDLTSLNRNIAELQDLVRKQKGYASNNLQKHSGNVVVQLQSRLVTLSSDFKNVLELRTQSVKEQKARSEQFSSANSASALLEESSAATRSRFGENNQLTSRNRSNMLTNGAVSNHQHTNGGNEYESSELDGLNRENFKQSLQLIEQQDAYIETRAETMQRIEQTIVELGGIFQQLATLVKEQEELVQRIDMNVEEASTHVEAAHFELLKYFKSVSSNRWLMLKVFGVLFVFFLVFVLFVL